MARRKRSKKKKRCKALDKDVLGFVDQVLVPTLVKRALEDLKEEKAEKKK